MCDESESAEQDTTPIRVVLSNLPDVLSQVITARFEAEPGIVITHVVRNPLDTLVAVREGADLVVLGAAVVSPPPGVLTHLLAEFPDVRALVMTPSGDTVAVYWLGLRTQQTQVGSADHLIAVLRRLADHDAATLDALDLAVLM